MTWAAIRVYFAGMIFRARFDGKVFIPDTPPNLPIGCVFEVDVREIESPEKGSGKAIVEVVRQLPHLEPGDSDALMEAIDSAKLPTEYRGCFDEDEDAVSDGNEHRTA
jgi:hypothetical protein